MKITNQKLLGVQETIDKLQSTHLSIRTLYKFSKLSKAVGEEMDFYREKLRALIEEYAQRDENGQPVQEAGNIRIIPEKISECNERINELLNLEVELPDIEFELDELENISLSMDEFNHLLPFIVE